MSLTLRLLLPNILPAMSCASVRQWLLWTYQRRSLSAGKRPPSINAVKTAQETARLGLKGSVYARGAR